MTLQNFWQNIEYRVDILKEILPSHSLFWCLESSKLKVANGTKSNGLNVFLQIKGIVEQGLGQFFTISVILISSIKPISSSISFKIRVWYCLGMAIVQCVLYRRVASGGAGGAMPLRFSFLPPLSPIYFLPPHGIFWGGISCCFWPEKTFKFVISARKSLRISAKTFSFFFFEITWFWPEKTFKFVISARKSLRILAKTFSFSFFFGDHLIFTKTSPQSDSGIMKKLCPPDFNFAPPISRSWRRPWYCNSVV